MGKSAHGLGLIGSLAGLGVVIYFFVKLQSLDTSTTVSVTSVLGFGFWLAGIAFVIGLIGAIMGMGEAPAMAKPPMTGPTNWPQQPPPTPPYQSY